MNNRITHQLKGERYVVMVIRDDHTYVFSMEETEQAALKIVQRASQYAADRSCNFRWYDAAIVAQKVRQLIPARSTLRRIAKHESV